MEENNKIQNGSTGIEKKKEIDLTNLSLSQAIEFTIGFIISAIFMFLVGGGLYMLDKYELAGKFTLPDWLAAPIAFIMVGIFIGIFKYSTGIVRLVKNKLFKNNQ